MMIPRTVHYCWFGGTELPPLERSCMETWPSVLQHYEIRRWDESNSDLDAIPYMRQAYERGRFAFASDVMRMLVLYEHGGIYLDTDVELLGGFDTLLDCPAFAGFENRTNVGTAVIGAEPGNEVIGKMLDYYRAHNFVDARGHEDTMTNVKVLERILQRDYGLARTSEAQNLGVIQVQPRAVFAPRRIGDEEWAVEASTLAIHHFSGSWLTERERRRGRSRIWRALFRPFLRRIRDVLSRLVGERRVKDIEIRIRNAWR